MNEKELGAALVRSAGDAKTDQLTEKLLRRDQLRVRLWTVLTVLAWLPAVLIAMGVLVYLALLFPAMAKVRTIREQQRVVEPKSVFESEILSPDPDVIMHEGRKINLRDAERDLDIGFKMMSVLTGFGLLSLAVATLFSLLLTHVTRSTTLRQINISLRDIAAGMRKPGPIV